MTVNFKRRSSVINIVVGAKTDTGRKRSNNQDCMCSIVAPNTAKGVRALVAVADGMGGHQGGEVASGLAIEGVVSHLGKNSNLDLTGVDRSETLVQVIHQIHKEVQSKSNTPETRGMGTTLSIAVIGDHNVIVGHVGDSRIYRARKGKFTQLTEDHSWVAEEVRRGNLTAEEAAVHPRRNLISQAIGVTPDIEPMVAEFDIALGDKILLCSDGLHGLVTDEDILGTIEGVSPSIAVETLVDKANAAGGPDNVTVVLADIVATTDDPAPGDLSEADTICLTGKRRSLAVRLLVGLLKLPLKLFRRSGRK